MRIRRHLAQAFILLIIILSSVIVFRAFYLFSIKPSVIRRSVRPIKIDEEKLYHVLSRAIQFKTVADINNVQANAEAFIGLQQWLKQSFPDVFSALTLKTFNHSLLLTWKGSEPSKKPILLAAHMDVVPVDNTSASQWSVSPYSGSITADAIWGRGALDNKNAVISILESVSILLKEGFTPKRTIYLAFGADEEVGGLNGAKLMSESLKAQGVELLFVDDEGMPFLQDLISGIKRPIAFVGIAEKGYMDVTLVINAKGGHASRAPARTSILELSKTIISLKEQSLKKRLLPTVQLTLEAIAPYSGLKNRLVLSNLWLFKPLLLNVLAKNENLSPMIETSIVTTMLRAGVKSNVLPSKATAVMNVRILPGDTQKSVLKHINSLVDSKDYSIQITKDSADPIPASSVSSKGYQLITKTIEQLFHAHHLIVAPSLLIALTDSRHYKDLTKQLFRLIPILVKKQDVAGLHGVDEHISKKNLVRMVKYYHQLLWNVNE